MRISVALVVFYIFIFNLNAQNWNEHIVGPDMRNPNKSIAADIDGDGNIDAVIGTAEDGKLFWLQNLGGFGNFSSPIFITETTGSITSILAQDIDSDGDIDLLMSLTNSGRVVFLENTDGLGISWSYQTISSELSEPFALSLADIDGDIDLDLVAVSKADSLLVWYENIDGFGNFGDEIIISDTIQKPESVYVADFDNDGDNDLIVNNFSFGDNRKLFLFQNENNGLFFEQITPIEATGSGATVVTGGDLDGDNLLDVLFAQGGALLKWLKNVGNNTFDAPIEISSNSSDDFKSMEIVDLDDDGDNDILLSSATANEISWYENLDGNGNLSEQQFVDEGASYVTSVIPADFDNDGDLDLLSTHLFDNRISIYEKQANGDYGEEVIIMETGKRPTYLLAEDFDSDGDLDLISTFFEGEIKWYENLDGTGDFSQEKPLASFSSIVREFSIADFDNDGDKDLIGAYQSFDAVFILYNGGDETIGFISSYGNIEGISSVKTGDFDGDGDIDFVTGGYDVQVFLNDGTGVFSPSTTLLDDNFSVGANVNLADINGDGDLDIIATLGNFQEIVYFDNIDGQGTFSDKIDIYVPGANFFPITTLPADLDNDGDVDLVVNSDNDGVEWLENLDGNGTYGEPKDIFNDGGVNLGDIDNDGDLDVILSIYQNISWIPNLNNADSFGMRIELPADVHYADLFTTKNTAIGDFDGDGDLDIAATASETDKISWQENPLIKTARIKGTIFLDENENAIFDNNEIGLYNQKIQLQPNAEMAWSSNAGNFNFLVAPGEHELAWDWDNDWQLTTDSLVEIEVLNFTDTITQNFGLKPLNENHQANISLSSAATRCGFIVPFWLTYTNNGNQLANGTTMLELDALTSFVSAFPAPDSIENNQYFWFFENLNPTYSNQISLQLQMPSVDFIGEIINLNTNVDFEDSNEMIIANDSHLFSSEINCSYDPNDKLVDPNFPDFPNYTLLDEEFLYTIRFQNTGTDTAINISIIDYLDENLDWTTFQPIASSHDYQASLSENGKITFQFDNIYLPDSTVNQMESHGFVQYQILPKDSLIDYTRVKNTAEIYFDFNPAIFTNTTENVIVSQYPIAINAVSPLCRFDENGELIINFPPAYFQFNWNNGMTGNEISNLPFGDYSIVVSNEEGEVVADTSLFLTAPEILQIETSATAATNNSANGTAIVTSEGGTFPYTYLWSTIPPQTNDIATNLETGFYEVTVTDANNCTAETEVFVDNVVNTQSVFDNLIFTIYPNPTTDNSIVQFEFIKKENWNLEIQNIEGKLIQELDGWNQKKVILLEDLPNGVYTVSLRVNGKIEKQKLVVIK